MSCRMQAAICNGSWSHTRIGNQHINTLFFLKRTEELRAISLRRHINTLNPVFPKLSHVFAIVHVKNVT